MQSLSLLDYTMATVELVGAKCAARGPKLTHQRVQSGPRDEFTKCENYTGERRGVIVMARIFLKKLQVVL